MTRQGVKASANVATDRHKNYVILKLDCHYHNEMIHEELHCDTISQTSIQVPIFSGIHCLKKPAVARFLKNAGNQIATSAAN
jgi:hypothetical protein